VSVLCTSGSRLRTRSPRQRVEEADDLGSLSLTLRSPELDDSRRHRFDEVEHREPEQEPRGKVEDPRVGDQVDESAQHCLDGNVELPGCLVAEAENTPVEPDPDHAGEGSE
jgi:hypothetical protein